MAHPPPPLPAQGPLRVLIDTDCANEIDDQFALAWALLAPERLRVEATVAEPFSFRHHLAPLRAGASAFHREWSSRLAARGLSVDDLDRRLVGPAEGMERSLAEIGRIQALCGARSPALAGARRYMRAPEDAVLSEGAEAIVELATGGPPPLYVAAMGCLTNVAAALIRAPEIAGRIVVLWTAGFPTRQPHPQDTALNLVQDPHAARHVFSCGVPLVYLPGFHVGAQLRLSKPEMRDHVRGRGALGDALWALYDRNPLHEMFATDDVERRSWVMWDMIDVAWLIDPRWVPTALAPAPRLGADLGWRAQPGGHPIREAHGVARDDIFRDFFDRLAARA